MGDSITITRVRSVTAAAMAAARVWTGSIIASDIDEVAVDVAEANLKANGMAGQVRCLEATGFDHPELGSQSPYDLIFANILKESEKEEP